MVRVDAVELQCLGIKVGAGEGLNVYGMGLRRVEPSVVAHVQGYGCYLQQGICTCIEAAGLHVHDHW